MNVTATALPTLSCYKRLPRCRQITQDRTIAVLDDDARRHLDDQILATAAIPITSLTRLSTLGAILSPVGEIKKCAALRIGNENHRPTAAPITACGTTTRPSRLAPKRRTAVAAVAATDKNRAFVDKLHGFTARPT